MHVVGPSRRRSGVIREASLSRCEAKFQLTRVSLSCWFSAPDALSRHREAILVAQDTQVFQHIARCAPCSYLHGGQQFTLGPFLLLLPGDFLRAARSFLADSHGRP